MGIKNRSKNKNKNRNENKNKHVETVTNTNINSGIINTDLEFKMLLHVAVQCNQYDLFVNLLNHPKVDVNTVSDQYLTALDLAVSLDKGQMVEIMLAHPKYKVLPITNYRSFKILMSSPLIDAQRLSTQKAGFDPTWIVPYLKWASDNDNVVAVEKLIAIDRKLVENAYIDNEPYFIYLVKDRANNLKMLLAKHRFNPNVKSTSGESLLDQCYLNSEAKYLLQNPDLKFDNVTYNTMSHMSYNHLNLLIHHPNFLATVRRRGIMSTLYLVFIQSTDVQDCKRILVALLPLLDDVGQIDMCYNRYYGFKLNHNLRNLLQEYINTKGNIINQWRADVKEPISYLFTLATLVTDEYPCVNAKDKDEDKNKDQNQNQNQSKNFCRWLNIIKQLPIELQTILCHLTVGYDNGEWSYVPGPTVECQARSIFGSYQYINST
jgi:hypothetical protein